ncbi:MAG: aldehyde dehydrogenase family protein, partial [Spirochaetota bacterium]
MLLSEHYAEKIAEQLVSRIKVETETMNRLPVSASGTSVSSLSHLASVPARTKVRRSLGIYETVDEAVAAALRASVELARFPLSRRGEIITLMRKLVLDNLEFLARLAHEETGMGRVEDKIKKNRLIAEKTPGIEALTTSAFAADNGLTLDEFAPYGVIGAIIPSTNPTETVINNGISMFAAGNSVVFNPHPNATVSSLTIISMLNKVIVDNGGPADCFVGIAHPSIESAEAIMHHPQIPFLAVTGAEGVVKAAMKS